MGVRKLKIESTTFDEHGLGSRMLIVFNRNLNPIEQDGIESRIQRVVNDANKK